ncbi:hypothetical protein E2C01_005743 [Portunus trituberculatus]|uniref:Uncharacterized protein n=1 Tax=Portunus trituberculatus TaxID=210409 RepID=A0A5B7CV60_PORTR|nr:hypothetical protein [Portunus trituberculatus]
MIAQRPCLATKSKYLPSIPSHSDLARLVGEEVTLAKPDTSSCCSRSEEFQQLEPNINFSLPSDKQGRYHGFSKLIIAVFSWRRSDECRGWRSNHDALTEAAGKGRTCTHLVSENRSLLLTHSCMALSAPFHLLQRDLRGMEDCGSNGSDDGS